MSRLLIKNIGLMPVDRHGKPFLCGSEMAQVDLLHDAWLLVEDGRFAAFGTITSSPPSERRG